MSEAIAGGKLTTLERRRMSWEDYLALPEHPRTEWVDGEVVVTPGASWPHQRASRRLANHLEVHQAPEYASAGIAHYWVVDLEDPSIEVSANVDGRWELVARVDERAPRGEAVVGQHGTVPLDLAGLLDG